MKRIAMTVATALGLLALTLAGSASALPYPWS